MQQLDIIDFLDYMNQKYENASIYSEIETNGTVRTPKDFFGRYIQQVNCSPKLSNSGNRKGMRINPGVLYQINEFNNSWFKFVVSTEDNIKEVQDDFIKPNKLDEKKVILMPGLSEQKNYFERTRWVYEMGKKYGYRAISRGHIAAWDKTTGV
jgi:organic radical activating enzyme